MTRYASDLLGIVDSRVGDGSQSENNRKSMIAQLSDTDLLLRLTNFEDHFVERKTSSDSKDWLKTMVGFANSAPVGYPAVLYIGVRDGGEVEPGVNLDSLQKTLGKKLEDAFPAIYYMCKVLAKDGRQFLAVIVPGSEARPHFAGPSYVRVGSVTVVASEPQFQTLIAQRQSKAYEILKWKGQIISLDKYRDLKAHSLTSIESSATPCVVDCNQFYVTLRFGGSTAVPVSYPLRRVERSFDHENKRLKLEVHPI